MKKLFKISLLVSAITALIVDIFIILQELQICTIFGSESLIYYPALVVTFLFGTILFDGLFSPYSEWSLLNVYGNLFYLLIEFIYLFTIIFSISSILLLIKKSFYVITSSIRNPRS